MKMNWKYLNPNTNRWIKCGYKTAAFNFVYFGWQVRMMEGVNDD